MDPNACWGLLISCLNNSDEAMSQLGRSVLVDASEALRVWLMRGGSMPEGAVEAGLTREGVIRLTRATEYYVTDSVSVRDF